MRGGSVALLAILLSTGGCTHIVANTSQFYLAQDYLPLPSAARDLPGDSAAGSPCVAGPVRARHRVPGERFSATVLPGMTLHVVQTSYAASRQDNAVPVVADWRWTLPASAASSARDACADDAGAVPSWQRSDLLHVRALLSGAQLLRGKVAPSDRIKPIYFDEAIRASCTGASVAGAGLGCAEGPFLSKFVAGLELNLRAQGRQEDGDPQSTPPVGPPFEPSVPANVLAATGAPAVADRGYGAWYASLSGFRYPADLFPGGLQGERCRGPFVDGGVPNEAPAAQDAPVCKFAQASLEWSAPNVAFRMPGPSLSSISRLSLLRSGDPLLLFQPQDYLDPLDTGNGKACDGDPACLLRDRTMQGFTDIELLIPITLDTGERRWVQVGMSVAAYENANGLVVTRISRSTDWLPETLSFENGKTGDARKLAGSRRRIDLRFIARDKKPDIVGGVAIRDAKADTLFAPGDIITARRP